MRRRIASILALLSLMTPVTAEANQCVVPSSDGAVVVTGANTVVNNYWPGTGSPTTSSTTATLGAARNTAGPTIAAGDMLLLVQVQGATISTANSTSYGGSGGGRGYTTLTNTGAYEYVRALNAVGTAGGTLSFRGLNGAGPISGYTTAASSNTAPKKRFQVILVPQYRSMTLSGSITSLPWNGSTGGIVAFDVAGTMQFSGGSVNVAGQGFRGGGGQNFTSGTGTNTDYVGTINTANNLGAKGEGIVGTPNYTFDGSTFLLNSGSEIMGGSGARGAPGNAGGGATDGSVTNGDQNAGGGGGSNGGQGGTGGYAWCSSYNQGNCPKTGGIGGVALPGEAKSLLFMGGGGGAGTINNGTGNLANGASSSGAPGGGAMLIRVGTATGTGSLVANGGTFTSGTTNDGTGGGGAGGTIQFVAQTSTANISAQARGGNGISNSGDGQPHGPGGGGGGGFIASTVPLSTSVTGGSAGTTAANSSGFGVNYGAEPGGSGLADTSWSAASVPGLSSGAECTPNVSKEFSSASFPTGGTTRLTVTLENPNPTLAMTAAGATDTFPNGTTVSNTPETATTCTNGSVIAGVGTGSATLSGATIPARGSCTFSLNVTSTTAGSYVNTIPIGNARGTFAGAGGAALNPDPASATYSVTAGLSMTKSVQTMYDPVNQFTNPKAIPGAYVQYSLTVSNPSNLSVTPDTVVLSDTIPANTSLIVSSLYQQLGYPNSRGPFQYVEGATPSGLAFNFASLASAADSPDFSSDGTAFAYTPTPNAVFTDASVRAVRFKMFGTMAPNSSFTVNFLVRIN